MEVEPPIFHLDKYAQSTMTAIDSAGSAFGANSWLVEEMYEQFRSDPDSVSETWREFFSDYKPAIANLAPAPSVPAPVATATAAAPASNGAPSAAPARSTAPAAAAPAAPSTEPPEEVGEPIRGAGAAIAA